MRCNGQMNISLMRSLLSQFSCSQSLLQSLSWYCSVALMRYIRHLQHSFKLLGMQLASLESIQQYAKLRIGGGLVPLSLPIMARCLHVIMRTTADDMLRSFQMNSRISRGRWHNPDDFCALTFLESTSSERTSLIFL